MYIVYTIYIDNLFSPMKKTESLTFFLSPNREVVSLSTHVATGFP